MKLKQALFGIIAGACLAAAPQLQSAAYIKLGDIKGEATDADHREWIDVLSIDWGVIREVDPASGQLGAPKPKPVTCTKELDKSSPKLMETIVTGRVIPLVEIHLTRDINGGRVTYYKYELTNVLVTSFDTNTGAQADDRPVEDFSLNYEEIKLIYEEFDQEGTSKGTVEATWKVEEGTT